MNKDSINYDKISDDIFWLSTDTVLRLNVSLSKKNQDGTRRSFHSEYEYDSKYTDKRRAISIKRSFDFNLSLENIREKDCYTQIQSTEIYALRTTLDKVSKWFIGARIFGIVENKLIVKNRVNENLPLRNFKALSFEPVVIRFAEEVTPGIRIIFFNGIFTDVTADRFMGFKYHIDSIDLYTAASILVNYVEIPQFGTGLYSIPPEGNSSFGKEVPSSIPNREIKKQQSYFDKLDNM